MQTRHEIVEGTSKEVAERLDYLASHFIIQKYIPISALNIYSVLVVYEQ